jgi:Zn-dependent M28 family amino/carboxypeptidase
VNSGIKPKRSILFILFSNEESGLHGAKYYAENPLVPIEKTVAMFNNDCVGHGDSIQIGNGRSAPQLWQLTRSIDSLYTKGMIMRTWNGGGADAEPFHSKGIPSLYFVTYFSYTHLHLMSDKPETLNPVVFEKICKLGYMSAYEVSMGNYVRESVLN